jgi:hypothetical protein
VITYGGTGAYFLDKLDNGVWRLEVMPDIIAIRDPFERPAPEKEVTRVAWQNNPMQITLPDFGGDFDIRGVNDGNTLATLSFGDKFQIYPGTYLLTGKGRQYSGSKNHPGVIGLSEFVAPQPIGASMVVKHEPIEIVSAGISLKIHATIAGIDSGKVTLQINRLGGQLKSIPMVRSSGADYVADVPADLVVPGLLNYRIILQKGNEYAVFPGNFKGNPFAWNNYQNETWKTYVAAVNSKIELYNPTNDKTIRTYPVWRRGFVIDYRTGDKPGQLILRLATAEIPEDQIVGFQFTVIEKLKNRISELDVYDRLLIRARTGNEQPVNAKVSLTDHNAFTFSAPFILTSNFQDIIVPLNKMNPGEELLLPRPYPGFLPLKFKAPGSGAVLKLSDVEKIEIITGQDIPKGKPVSLEVEYIWLQKGQ